MTSLFSTLSVIPDFTEKEQVTFPQESIIKKKNHQLSKNLQPPTVALEDSLYHLEKKKISKEVINLLQKIT